MTAANFAAMMRQLWPAGLACLTLLAGCASAPPRNPDNICQVFRENEDWYAASSASEQKWGVPVPVQMAIIAQESAFVADAQPPRSTILGFIPWFRSSSAYGYPQAKDETWEEYRRKSGNDWASREDFADSCDFVAWYCAISHQKLGIANSDANNLYLTYHEGLNGYRRQTHAPKTWLLSTAKKVQQRALRYQTQLSTCKQEFEEKQ